MRKFYNDLLAIRDQVELYIDTQEKYNALMLQLPYINMLLTKAEYARGRKAVGSSFVDLMRKMLSGFDPNQENKKNYEHFCVLCSFFEALIAYSTAKLKK